MNNTCLEVPLIRLLCKDPFEREQGGASQLVLRGLCTIPLRVRVRVRATAKGALYHTVELELEFGLEFGLELGVKRLCTIP
jgi:hypothetical protein